MFSAVYLILVCLARFVISDIIRNFSNNEFADDENRQYIKEEGLSVEDNPNSIDILPGVYPTYAAIPRTGFSCEGKLIWQYYADPETDCQVFHICETQYSKISFICPVGSIFNQKHLICDWFYNFECSTAVSFYPPTNEFSEEGLQDGVEKAGDEIGFDLNLASPRENSGLIKKAKIREAFTGNNRSNVPRRFQNKK